MLENKIHKSKEYRVKKAVVIVLSLILIVMAYLFENASFVLRAVSMVEFIILFYFVDHFFEVNFKARHYLYIIIIAISGLLLSPLFFIWPNYDKIQHLIQPMFICSILFYLTSKLGLKRKWAITFAFFTTIAILGLFEVGEFTLDSLFDLKLQGVYLRDIQGLEKFNILMNPLNDTMIDLVLGIIGTGIYSIFLALFRKKG